MTEIGVVAAAFTLGGGLVTLGFFFGNIKSCFISKDDCKSKMLDLETRSKESDTLLFQKYDTLSENVTNMEKVILNEISKIHISLEKLSKDS